MSTPTHDSTTSTNYYFLFLEGVILGVEFFAIKRNKCISLNIYEVSNVDVDT